MSDFPVLETKRLLLREVIATDAAELFAIHCDAEAMRWFGSDPLADLQQAEKLIEAFAAWRKLPSPGTRWALVRKNDHRFLGTCGLFKWNRLWKSCVVGYELGSFAQGQGFMMEALSAILDWGFEHMELNRVEAQVHAENTPSIKLLRQLGFEREGCMRQAGFWRDRYHDLELFGLLREEYKAKNLGHAG